MVALKSTYKLVLPEWTYDLPNKALLVSKDLLKISGYKNLASISDFIKRGQLPEPTIRKIVRKGHKPTRFWSMKSLRQWEQEQNESSV